MRLVFLGPPGGGKGTHAKLLADKLHLAHLAAGDCLRRHIRAETPLGKKAKKLTESGDLVPDKLVNEMMEEEIWRSKNMYKGFILDGYPRTLKQAESLDKYCTKMNLHLDSVINFNTDENVIIERLAGRRISPSTGNVYHIKNLPPKKEGICDITGEKLIQREDDKPETVKHRLDVYHKESQPIVDFYKHKKLLMDIRGDEDMKLLHPRLLKICEELKAKS